jgi:hypothetical protein
MRRPEASTASTAGEPAVNNSKFYKYVRCINAWIASAKEAMSPASAQGRAEDGAQDLRGTDGHRNHLRHEEQTPCVGVEPTR